MHDAIQALSAVGLVASRPGKGTWVREDGLDVLIHPEAVRTRLGELNARKVYEARAVIEIALAEMAARRARPDEVAAIWAALAQLEASQEEDDAFAEADLAFHLAVARASKNELLEQFYHLSRKLIVDVIHEMVSLPRVKEDSIRLQRAIASAIQEGDSVGAQQAAARHMAYVDDLLRRWLAQPEGLMEQPGGEYA